VKGTGRVVKQTFSLFLGLQGHGSGGRPPDGGGDMQDVIRCRL